MHGRTQTRMCSSLRRRLSFSLPSPSKLVPKKVLTCSHPCLMSSRLSRLPRCLGLPHHLPLPPCLSFPLISRPYGAVIRPLEVQIGPHPRSPHPLISVS